MKTVIIDNLSVLCDMREAANTLGVADWNAACDDYERYECLAPKVVDFIDPTKWMRPFLGWCEYIGANVILCDQVLGRQVIGAFLMTWCVEDKVTLTWDSTEQAIGIARYEYKTEPDDIMVFTTRPGRKYSMYVEDGVAVLDGYIRR